MKKGWMYTRDVFIDIHENLHPYTEVIDFFKVVEEEFSVKEYCNGSNAGGRWIFQIYSIEFIQELVDCIQYLIGKSESNRPIAEVMSGDGKLSQLLDSKLTQQIITTDAKTGRYNIAYPKWVKKETALETVQKYNPLLVIISWEPYLSMEGIEIVKSGIPLIWIGNPNMCGHKELFEYEHRFLESRYAICRHDTFITKQRNSKVVLFNC